MGGWRGGWVGGEKGRWGVIVTGYKVSLWDEENSAWEYNVPVSWK